MDGLRIVVASDSFKGSLSSARIVELVREAAARVLPGSSVRGIAVADGGEGTAAAIAEAAGGELVPARVTGPLGDVVSAAWALLPGGRAVVEMAAASGLTLVDREQLDVAAASSFGTGQLIAAALDADVREIALGIGGSATNDGGMGCMRALGARFLDAGGEELAGIGSDLGRVAALDLSAFDERVAGAKFTLMCDVDNPLLGEQGCARVFAPQKGATVSQVEELEAGMENYARVLAGAFGRDLAAEAGSGAAGGMGFAAKLFLGARSVRGIDAVLDLAGFDALLEGCDLVITGEGHADAQSAHGKAVSGVARRCKAAGVACVAIVGGAGAGAEALLDCGVSAIVPCVTDVCSIEQALEHAEQNYLAAAERTLALIALGRP